MSKALEIIPHVFSEYLKEARWIGWKYELRNDKENKSPINPYTGQYASSTDPKTWATFEVAERAVEKFRLSGRGIIMGRGLGGVDLDGCRNPETGAITPWAQEIIDDFKSYSEVSPSKTGIKIFATGAPEDLPANTLNMLTPPINGKAAKVEVFVHSRYFAVTGDVLDQSPDEIANCGDYGGAWDRLVSKLSKQAPVNGRALAGVTELPEALKRAMQERESLRLLWTEGKEGGKDRSRNDASLACALAAGGFSDSDIEAALRNYPLGQIGQGSLHGTTADRQIIRLLGMAAEARQKTGRQAVVQEKPEAQPADIVEPATLAPQMKALYERGLEPGADPGWPSVRRLWTVRKGEWTLVTGIPSHGKSAFINAVIVNLAKRENWKWGIYSAENLPHELHMADLMEQYIGKPFNSGFYQRLTLQEHDRALQFLQDHVRFIAPPEEHETIERIMQNAEKLADDLKIDGLVVDPWNELNHSWAEQKITETEYISRCLKRIRRVASRKNIHVIVVAHPMKLQKDKDGKYPIPTPYDVSGSAHWRNKADCAICVWRDEGKPGESTIFVQKIRRRFVGKIGRADLRYDVATGQFSEPMRSREPGDGPEEDL